MKTDAPNLDQPPKDAQDWLRDYLTLARGFMQRVYRSVNGNLGFGDGTNPDNLLGVWVSVADTGLANTDFTVAHNLGSVPVGVHVMIPPGNGVINKGAGAWTTTNIFLRCSVANQAVTVFVLGNSVTLLS